MGNDSLKNKLAKRRKALLIYITMCVFFFALLSRLGYLMFVASSKYKAIAASQQTSEITISAKRGRILDRNGNELAVSADVYKIDLDLKTLRQELSDENMTFDELAPKLASILSLKKDDVLKILNSTLPNGMPASSAVLKRRVEQDEIDKIKALNYRGIIISPDTKRYYPQHNFLANVLGHINDKGDGVSGVELSYNKDLSGIPGKSIYEKDIKSNQLPYGDSQYTKPVDGKDVVLTIDETIQNFAEKAASKALTDNKAKAVNIMVMDPTSGEILAMVNKPDYDPNTPAAAAKTSDELQNIWKNKSVENSFEPGSIFKVITAAAALESNTGLADQYICNGNLKVANRIINCWKTEGHGAETFADILKNSCNVGFMELGQKLGKETLVAFAKKMGIGQKTGIDLPGESAGIVKDVNKMGIVDLSTMAFGQGVATTQVQYMAAFNAVANGGTWIRPHIMKEVVHTDDNNKQVVDRQYSDFGKKTVYDSNLASTLRGDLERVVSDPTGVGHNAYIPGYGIAGKTGTAQKVYAENGGYGHEKYMSSFAGMAPVNNPKITLLITIDEPDSSNYYASQVAAPVAKELYNDIFNYLILKGDMTIPKVN